MNRRSFLSFLAFPVVGKYVKLEAPAPLPTPIVFKEYSHGIVLSGNEYVHSWVRPGDEYIHDWVATNIDVATRDFQTMDVFEWGAPRKHDPSMDIPDDDEFDDEEDW